ncbi:MAG: outer membrane lipoprotein-sorting protein, partial [Fibrobacterota bacterium]
MSNIKKTAAVLLVLISVSLTFSASLSGLDIMKKSDAVPQGKTRKSIIKMELIDRNGHIRERKVVSAFKESDEGEKTLMTFKSPADVEGTGFLNWTYNDPGKDDDQWLFLPALGRIRRISSSSKGDYFMGTEFTYDDMGDRKPDEDTHKLLGEEKAGEKLCYKIESVPKEEDYMYSRKLVWIDKESYLPVKVKFFDEDGEFLKEMNTSGIKKIGGFWTVTGMVMENVQKDRKTKLTFNDIVYNSGVRDMFFTKRMLKKGLPDY